MRLSDRTRAQNAIRARLAREKQRGSSCLMLPVQMIREIVPCLDAETVKFFLIAASYGDQFGRAWAGQREFMEIGYSSDATTALLRRLEADGLMRYIRQGERDPMTGRYFPNVYQFNALLYYIRKKLRSGALKLSTREFAPIMTVHGLKHLIFDSPSNEDHNQLVEPTPETSTKKPIPESRTRNHHHQPKNARGRVEKDSFEGVEGADSRIDRDASVAQSRDYLDSTADSSDSKPRKAKSNGNGKGKNSEAKQNDPSPNSAPPPSPDQVANPLPDPDMEKVAQVIKALGTRMPQARSIVLRHGMDKVVPAVEHLQAEMSSGKVNRPIGLLLHWLNNGLAVVGDHPIAKTDHDHEQDGQRYITGKYKDLITW